MHAFNFLIILMYLYIKITLHSYCSGCTVICESKAVALIPFQIKSSEDVLPSSDIGIMHPRHPVMHIGIDS